MPSQCTAHSSASGRAGGCDLLKHDEQWGTLRYRRVISLDSEGNGISMSGIILWVFRGNWGKELRTPGWREQIAI